MGDGFQNYGGLKALCEQAAEAAMPGSVTVVRPGFIVGPGDWTGRFNYWPLRARLGGEMLGPGDGSDPMQWIDVRDLADWVIELVEKNTTGVFLATGPDKPGTVREVIDTSIAVTKSLAEASGGSPVDTTVTWVPTAFLREQKIGGGDLPIWIPAEGDGAGFHRWNNAKAMKAGLTFRPLPETLRGVVTWYDTLKPEQQKRSFAGMSREREAEVLKAWHASQAKPTAP
jgi:2'-hydroxyisoflavone reductase